MSAIPTDLRQELIALLGRIIGPGPLPPDLQNRALNMLQSLMEPPSSVTPQRRAVSFVAPGELRAPTLAADSGTAANPVERRLVYVHGICRHSATFSDPWWKSLHPHVPTALGDGVLGQTRLEVIWSDIVNVASAGFTTSALGAGQLAGVASMTGDQQARQSAASEIKDALRDRVDRHLLDTEARHAMSGGDATLAGAPPSGGGTSGLISVPGLNCIDDFSIYLTSDGVRQQILNRFVELVRRGLQAGHELDIISHSWGTVVAYEGLRQLEDEGVHPPLVRNFFTVGAALSIGPVKTRLRPANRDGRRPASVRRWVNLNARGDIVGGPLKGRPYDVNFDFVNLAPLGCGSFLGLVNPQCAHGSYFDGDNVAVNRDIFARFIEQP